MGGVTGVGLGLRSGHIGEVLATRPRVSWFEVLTDNHLDPGPLLADRADAIAGHWPVALHGVGMNLGSTDPLDRAYVRSVGALADRLGAELVSDHLCFIAAGGRGVPDLLPLPYDEPTLDHLVDRIGQAQDLLGRRLLVENASAYLAWQCSTMPEWEFVARLAERADCHLLLDVNNLYVNAHNFDFDPLEYLAALPADRIRQLHLAGHDDWGDVLVDTHGAPVCDEVLELYRETLRRFGPVPTLLEWDRDVPPWPELLAEARRVEAVFAQETS
jgi:uncharacterized protein